MNETTGLTANDRDLIAKAREMGSILRSRSNDLDRLAGWQIAALADLAERLAGTQD